MSSFTAPDIAEMVRRRFALPEGAELQFVPLVDPALRQLSYDLSRDPDWRDWIETDPATTTATLDADGVADLTALIADPRILLECFGWGDIMPPSGYPSTQPFRMIANSGAGQLSGGYDSLVYKCWLQGTSLHTKSPDNNVTPLVGDISFSVAHWVTLDELSEPLVQRLVYGDYWNMPETERANAQN